MKRACEGTICEGHVDGAESSKVQLLSLTDVDMPTVSKVLTIVPHCYSQTGSCNACIDTILSAGGLL